MKDNMPPRDWETCRAITFARAVEELERLIDETKQDDAKAALHRARRCLVRLQVEAQAAAFEHRERKQRVSA